ncbi:MAG: hypothetical protein AAF570_29000, partial [Bacteroidota bacterium]
MDKSVFEAVYRHFEQCNYYPFLKKVGDYRRGMRLSDWHFYEILAGYSELMYPDASLNFQVLFQWFMLRKSGIDARLFHTEDAVYLNAFSDEIEFGFYTIEQLGRRYVNLTARRENLKLDDVEAYLTDFSPDEAHMPLSMHLRNLPHMTSATTIERLIEFKHRGNDYKVRIRLNRDHLRMMDDYPYYNQSHYFDIQLSDEAESTLLPQMEELMEGRTLSEKVEFLLSFTRTAFFYRDDRRRYGREKPMTPEQTLYHSYSDCEDRSALFFYLCRKLLELPVIVLDFETHVGTAIELAGAQGDSYTHKGRKFVYCEPTGPMDELKIGEMWEHVRKQKARILTDFI